MNNKIYVCACASRSFISKADVARLAAQLKAAGCETVLLADLCEMSADKIERLAELQGQVVVACHERAVKSLLDRCGVTARQLLNLRAGSVEDICSKVCPAAVLPADEDVAEQQRLLDAMPVKDGTDAWNPTLDKSRCIECRKCLEFCPFGVYEMVDGAVTVVHPHHCKNNCPACARHCPTQAIIFPKYTESPINGGLDNEDQAVQLDTKSLYSSALRERLKERRESVALLKKD